MTRSERQSTEIRVVVGITGASGAPYGLKVLDLLRAAGIETHLVVTAAGEQVLAYETGTDSESVSARASHRWPVADVGAPIASGTFRTAGMIVAPCSMRFVSAVASCRSSDLLERAADVTLKERRPLVLLARETPLHVGHLRQMLEAAQAGATIMPPVPAFYAKLKTLDDLVEQTAARAIDQLGIDVGRLRRWGEPAREGP